MTNKITVMPNTVEDLEAVLRNNGVDLTNAKWNEAIAKRQDNARERVKQEFASKRPRPEWYVKSKNIALALRDVSSLFLHFIIAVIAPICSIFALAIAEYASVYIGIEPLLEKDGHEWLAVFLSATLILSYFVIEWLNATEHDKIKNLTVNSKELKDRDMTVFYRSMQRTRFSIVVTIILFSTVGRLHSIFDEDGVWYNQMGEIFTDSSAVQFLEIFGAMLISVVLLTATHFIIQYLHGVYINAVGVDETNFFDVSVLDMKMREATEAETIKYLQYRVQYLIDRQANTEEKPLTKEENIEEEKSNQESKKTVPPLNLPNLSNQ
jgi:hypothetical protein